MGLPDIYVRWIYNFLKIITLKLGHDEIKITGGIPQGSCLSPLLFNLYTKDLHDLEDNNTTVVQYADDFLILSYSKDFDEAENNLNQKVKRFEELCGERNLSLNPDKTSTMYLAKGNRKIINLVAYYKKIK